MALQLADAGALRRVRRARELSAALERLGFVRVTESAILAVLMRATTVAARVARAHAEARSALVVALEHRRAAA